MVKLGVNIDHVATVRQARGGIEPDPVYAAVLAELGGADGITVHLREDRRHIQDRDIYILKEIVKTGLNLEMACVDEIIEIAVKTKPYMCTLVPEKRQELTTEGGLDVIGNFDLISSTVASLSNAGISVSLFIDPDKEQITAAAESGADTIEIHTGKYAEDIVCSGNELIKIVEAVKHANDLNLIVNAGHGLNYQNVKSIAAIPSINELNIGHSIISRSVFVGLERAVREMKELIKNAC